MKTPIQLAAFTFGVALALPVLAQDQMESAALTVMESEEYGPYLTDNDGRAVYIFSAEEPAESGEPAISCADECLKSWPLFTVDTELESYVDAEQDAYETLAGVMSHEDATVVTYNDRPLHYFAADADAEGPQGQDVEEFGGTWYLVTPEGAPVKDNPAEAPMEDQE